MMNENNLSLDEMLRDSQQRIERGEELLEKEYAPSTQFPFFYRASAFSN